MKTKTLQTLLTEKTKQEIFNDILDGATIDEIIDYFYFRYLCDEDLKFIHFIQRNMRMYKNQYEDYLRIESTEFDPFVTRYLEKYILNSGKDSTTGRDIDKKVTEGGKTINTTESAQNTVHQDVTNDNTETRNLKDDRALTNTENVSTTGTTGGTTYGKNITAQFAQANIPNLTIDPQVVDVDYATTSVNSAQTTTGSSGGTTRTTGNGTDINLQTGSVIDDGEQHMKGGGSGTKQGKCVESLDRTETLNKSKNTQIMRQNEEKIRLTGRENIPANVLLEGAREYIKDTNALRWLISRLEKCFIGNLRYEEDE